MEPYAEILTRLKRIEDFIKTQKNPETWMTQEQAMQEIGCKATKMKKLRDGNDIVWRKSGKEVMILRSSVERYNNKQSYL